MERTFTFWSYQRPKPGTNPQRRWRGDAEMTTEWAYAPLSDCGTYFDLSKQVSGFASEAEARAAASKGSTEIPHALKTWGTFYTV